MGAMRASRAQDLPAGSDTDCESWEHAEAAAPAAPRGEAIEVELGSPDPGAPARALRVRCKR